MIADLLIFLGVLAVLVLAHEFGHFLLARWARVNVEEFGFGFPPRLGGIRKGKTLYSFNLLPLGGFVKITGEDSAPPSADGATDGAAIEPGNFAKQPKRTRAMILGAGIVFNVILAYFLFAAALMGGVPVAADDGAWAGRIADPRVVAIDVAEGSAAERAGIRLGDAIVGLGSADAEMTRDISIARVQEFMQMHRGTAIEIMLMRDGAENTLRVMLPETVSEGEGILGIAMTTIGRVDVPWWTIPWYALQMTASVFWGMLAGIAALVGLAVQGTDVSGMVSGPVGIFSIVRDTFDFGFPYFITLVATLSINLAIINLIPFPGLDGGRLFFLLIEAVRGRAVGVQASRLAHGMGFAILIVLMVVITYYDIRLRL